MARLFGLPHRDMPHPISQFVAMVHAEDRDRVVERCRLCATEGEDFDLEYRIVRADGEIRWLYNRGKVFRDAKGRISYMTGACVDVTKSKSDEEALRQSEARFSELANVRGGLPATRLRRVLDYIAANPGGDLSLDTLAGLACLSPHHFAQAFKRSAGLSPHQYVLRHRISKAQEMLSKSVMPLAELAYLLGFPSQAHFTTMFRRVVGTTPGAYRLALTDERVRQHPSRAGRP